jgi:parallel beta-helix repeat protein
VTPNPARRPLLASAAVLSLAVPVLAVAAPASADHLACGNVIVVDTRLTHDLVCGPGHGLVIGADGVVLDLGGYSITGTGAYGAGAGAGVWVDGWDHVTIAKGEISGFATAVDLQQSTDSTVSKLTLHDNDRGVNVGGGGGHLIEKNTISDNGRDAIRLAGSMDNLIAKNVLDGNVYGIGIANGSVDNVVEKNVITGSQYWGIGLFEVATGTVLDKNVVTGTRDDGISVSAATSSSVLTKNETSDNGDDGIDVDSESATLTKNLAVGNGDLGIEAVLGVTDGGGNLAAGNGNPLQCTGVTCQAP